MNSKVHIPVGFLSCLVVYVLTYIYYENGDTFSLAFFGCFGSMWPDLDQMYGRHRDSITHSFLAPALVILYVLGWNFGRYYDMFYFTLAVGFHLLFDLKFKKEGKMGTYCIVKPGFVVRKQKKNKSKPETGEKKLEKKKALTIDRMTARNTDIWLSLNAVACFAACFVLYVLF